MRCGALVPLYSSQARARVCAESGRASIPVAAVERKKKKETHMCSVLHAEMLEDVQGVYP